MKTYLVSFLMALCASLILTWIMREFGMRLKLLDLPGGRKIHESPIPRLGGPGMALSLFLPLACLLLWDNRISYLMRFSGLKIWAIVIGGTLTVIMGLWDDISHLRARYKLLMQIAIAALVYFMGIQIRSINLPFIGPLDMGAFSLLVTIIWIISFMNVLNLIDGMDGLCGGIVFIAAISVFIVAVIMDSILVALFAAAMAGAVLGFLRYNFYPATIFMGDSGSYFLGFILATISILGYQKSSVAVAVVAPMLALGVPILDTVLAVTRRVAQGRPISAPDRGHLHHRLLAKGYSPGKVVIIFYGFSILLAVGSVIVAIGHNLQVGLVLTTSMLVIITLVLLTRGVLLRHAVPISKADILKEILPDYLVRFLKADSWEELTLALAAFSEDLELDSLEVVIYSNVEVKVWRWGQKGEAPKTRRGRRLTAKYKLKHDHVEVGLLAFSWYSEIDRVASETDYLLALTTGMVAKVLRERIKLD